jgi:hypothetical protein
VLCGGEEEDAVRGEKRADTEARIERRGDAGAGTGERRSDENVGDDTWRRAAGPVLDGGTEAHWRKAKGSDVAGCCAISCRFTKLLARLTRRVICGWSGKRKSGGSARCS